MPDYVVLDTTVDDWLVLDESELYFVILIESVESVYLVRPASKTITRVGVSSVSIVDLDLNLVSIGSALDIDVTNRSMISIFEIEALSTFVSNPMFSGKTASMVGPKFATVGVPT